MKKKKKRRAVAVVRGDSLKPPTCPFHPDIYLGITDSDDVAIDVMTWGGVLHMRCLYGCEAECLFQGAA